MNRRLAMLLLMLIQTSVIAADENPKPPPDTRSESERSLYQAIRDHDPAKVQALLEKGVDVNVPAIERVCRTPLMTAVQQCYFVPRAKKDDADWIKREVQIIKLLLDRKADPNGEGDEGCPPIVWAVHTKNLDVVKIMIEHGATLNPEKGRFR